MSTGELKRKTQTNEKEKRPNEFVEMENLQPLNVRTFEVSTTTRAAATVTTVSIVVYLLFARLTGALFALFATWNIYIWSGFFVVQTDARKMRKKNVCSVAAYCRIEDTRFLNFFFFVSPIARKMLFFVLFALLNEQLLARDFCNFSLRWYVHKSMINKLTFSFNKFRFFFLFNYMTRLVSLVSIFTKSSVFFTCSCMIRCTQSTWQINQQKQCSPQNSHFDFASVAYHKTHSTQKEQK